MERLINYLKDNYDCTDYLLDEFERVILLNKSKGRKLIIRINEDTYSDCIYESRIKENNKYLATDRSNFEHLTNIVIRIFME